MNKKQNKKLKTLVRLIEKWSVERGLSNAEPLKQFDKLIEEHGELVEGINKDKVDIIKDSIGDMFVVMTVLSQQIKSDMQLSLDFTYFAERTDISTVSTISHLRFLGSEIKFCADRDAQYSQTNIQTIITVLVYIISEIAKKYDSDLLECVELAYNEIKDRKGKNVNGIYVKESDLQEDN